MAAAETRYRTLVEQIPAVTFMAALGEDQNEIYVSPHIEALLGFTQDEWLADPFLWFSQLHVEDRAVWNEEFARGCQTGGPFRADCRFLARDGRMVWVHGEARLLRDAEGRPAFLQGVAFDITDIKAAQELRTAYEVAQARAALLADIERKNAELSLLNAELERSNAEFAMYGHAVSHDLREPLRMIVSYLQLLDKRVGRRDPDTDLFLHHAFDGARRLQAMTRDLLAYAKVGARPPAPVPTDSGEVLQRICSHLQVAITETGAEISADPLPTVPADPGLFAQLLQNLIENALKFRKPDVPPRIHVSAQKEFGAHQEFGAHRESTSWRFTLSDNGIGMEPKDAQRVFQLFQRLHGRDEYPGTGLGLTLCRRIVEQHGGRIWVESAPGQGATFTFTWPAHSVDS